MLHMTKQEMDEWRATPAGEKARAYLDFLVDWRIVARGTDEEYEANVMRLAEQIFKKVSP